MEKKKNIIIIVLVLSIGVTIAYLQSTDTFENIFNAGTYSVITHEEFNSPDNWAPGDTTSKTITTTNQGTIPVRVRVKLTESWTSKNNSDLPLLNNGERMAIINLANTDDWIKDGDYYYYVGELNPGESTSSLIQSVTFNPEYQGDVTCTTVNNVKTCESSSSGYSGGTYTLNITTETVQADAYQSVWNLSYNPTEERIIYDVSDDNEYSTYEDTNKEVFLRKTFLGEQLLLTEIGFIYNDNVYYLKNKYENDENIYFEENKTLLLNVFGSENCEINTDEVSCSKGNIHSYMTKERTSFGIYNPEWLCLISNQYNSECLNGKQ